MPCKNPAKTPLLVTRSPANKNENLDDAPTDKRRKIDTRKMARPANPGRVRQTLKEVNSDIGNAADVSILPNECSDGRSATTATEFTHEDIENLLNEKMKGKNTASFKEKNEQMMQYIKKLRTCIKWQQLEHEKLHSMVESSEKTTAALDLLIKSKDDALTEMTEKCACFEEKFTNAETARLEAVDCCQRETEARAFAEKMQASLSSEVASLQENKKCMQEYNTSLQQYNSKLQLDVFTANENISKLNQEKNAMTEALSKLRCHLTLQEELLASSKASLQETLKRKEELLADVGSLRSEVQKLKEERDMQLMQIQGLKSEIEKFADLTGKMEGVTCKVIMLEETCSSQQEEIMKLNHQLEAAYDKLKSADLSVSETRAECEDQEKIIKDLELRLADSELRFREGEELRKRLHNTILELKGNIRVFCRVRPLLPDDDCISGDSFSVAYPTSTESLGRGIELSYNGQKYPFLFDKVFNHEASQQDVFVEISQLVQSALDGYKVCVFAYGQTGSGKTYTMMGRLDVYEKRGIIARSLEQMFETSLAKVSQGWTYKMQVSMLEIYNETIRDLLSPNKTNLASGCGGKQFAIKHDSSGNTCVSDLTIVDVSSIEEVTSLLRRAAQSRSVHRTNMNEESSRSHFVFILRVTGVNKSTEEQVQGVLNLIDLAGSERVSKSGSVGDQLDEAKAINLSLTTLKKVISSLTKKASHIPYRESKLTYLLQPCLGGDSKTLMFVNISPVPSSCGESLDSLRFANMVNNCEIGTARRQTQVRHADSRWSFGP